MFVIRTAEQMAHAIETATEPNLRSLLQQQHDRLEEWRDYSLEDLALFIVIEAGDTRNMLNAINGVPAEFGPAEITRQQGVWLELTFVLSDSGYGLVLLVQLSDRTDCDILALGGCSFADKVKSNRP